MPDKNKEKPKGILRRSEARMAAVKALYATSLGQDADTKPDPFIITLDILSAYDSGDVDHHFDVRPDEKFLSQLIAGSLQHLPDIDTIITRNLNENWQKERMSQIIMALLRAAVFELSSEKQLPFKIIINEYVNIARGFCNDKEASFVNGILDKIAHEVRE